MGAEVLSSRAIIGMFYAQLAQDAGVPWISQISNYFPSDQQEELYAWLGMPPAMREWIGGRQAKELRDDGFYIRNKLFEATLRFRLQDIRRDKTGQVATRIRELVERSNTHWASMLSTNILNGAAGVGYDGQYFFSATHSEGSSGTQDNTISVDISTLPASVEGTITAPSPEEAKQAAMRGIQTICGFKDDQGEPMNETATDFIIMAPFSLVDALESGFTTPATAGVSDQRTNKRVQVIGNARLSSWTDKFAVFRADSAIKPLIRQEEVGVIMSAKAEGSEFEHDNNMHEYGIKAERNTGYGRWQYACLVTMT